jgi:hypothetical protein
MLKKLTKFAPIFFPGLLTKSYGYREMFSLLSGSWVRRIAIGCFIFLSASLTNLLMLLGGSDGLPFVFLIGFILKDASLLIGMFIVSLIHFSHWRKNHTALEDLALTPVPRELLPGLLQRSLLRRAFYILTITLLLEAFVAIAIAAMSREEEFLPLTLGVYLILSPIFLWFHYHTVYLVVSIFSRLAVKSHDALRLTLVGVTLLVVKTIIIFIIGVLVTIGWIMLWVKITEEATWLEDIFGNLIFSDSVLLFFAIPFSLLPGLLICGILKALCSLVMQRRFAKSLTNQIYGENE